MDLIDYRWKEWKGYKWILRYVDHLSGFAHVAPLKTKKAAVELYLLLSYLKFYNQITVVSSLGNA